MSGHLVDAAGVPLCPEAAMRDAMTEGEFWEHVTRNLLGESDDDPPEPSEDLILDEPCPVCGAAGACGWDAEGRPLIHAGGDDE